MRLRGRGVVPNRCAPHLLDERLDFRGGLVLLGAERLHRGGGRFRVGDEHVVVRVLLHELLFVDARAVHGAVCVDFVHDARHADSAA